MAGNVHVYSNSLIDKAVAEGRITKGDARLIKAYLNGSQTEDYSSVTRYNIFYILVLFRRYIGEYGKNTIDDLFDGVAKYKESNRNPATIVHQLSILKQFYGWLIDHGESSIPRDMISHKIKIRGPERAADSALNFDDAYQLIKACKNSRNRAFIALLFETGMRTKEACELRWKDLKPDKQGIFPISNGKMVPNPAPYFLATGYLTIWKNDYPGDASGENFVFVTRKGDPFTDKLAFRILGRVVKESGITKYVHLRSINRKQFSHEKKILEREAFIKKKLWEIG
ncbi:MAG TPA: tyrosine-type recombinase/integrase [Methanoregulaceae archaeon]|nr:tyrosine-type recombinase/integrase [Methanoregulaceae archaeon]